jgi:hypothetical protein
MQSLPVLERAENRNSWADCADFCRRLGVALLTQAHIIASGTGSMRRGLAPHVKKACARWGGRGRMRTVFSEIVAQCHYCFGHQLPGATTVETGYKSTGYKSTPAIGAIL